MSTHQKVKSPTKSSASNTHNAGAETPVQYIKGVGPRLGHLFNQKEIYTVKDLLYFFPRTYEDRSSLLKISDLKEGQKCTLAVRVLSSRKIPTRSFKTLFEVKAQDSSGIITFKWFYLPRGIENKFIPGVQFFATGTPKLYLGRPEIIHPEISWDKASDTGDKQGTESDPLNVGRVVPVYRELDGIPSRAFRKMIYEALQKYGSTLLNDLPEPYEVKHKLSPLLASIKEIHFPSSQESNEEHIKNLIAFHSPFHARLIYEEFFKFEYLILKQRLQMEKEKSTPLGHDGGQKAIQDAIKDLPFKLTGDQLKAMDEILLDLSKASPTNRLIQGDVGSGKTIVALLSALCALSEGYQVALMAPTEILAEQHFKNIQILLGEKIQARLLTGKSTSKERSKLQEELLQGKPILVIGTHALIEDTVQFKSLAVILIDEQHRFGVEQRRALKLKGVFKNEELGCLVSPHFIVLTATPIPRTLALTAYGDLSVSLIKEMPPGRTPIKTIVARGAAQAHALSQVKLQLSQGRQAYFIYPLVQESEAEGFTELKDAISECQRLQLEVFQDYKVGLLHGKMKNDDKASMMESFKKNEVQVLVSTTVVEVGVDVPNATVIVIEHAERFGLSQLHQLRGRVGRGAHQSYCYLMAKTSSAESTQARLEVLEETSDGFEIAEADLKIRGPGEFLGVKQSGDLPFKIADLVRDRDWLFKARDDAMELLKLDPDLNRKENLPFKNYLLREGKLQGDRLKTS